MFALPPALKVEEFADASPTAMKAAIELAIAQVRTDCVKDVFTCVDQGDLGGAMVTRQQYSTAEKVLRQLALILDETIKHGGTGKPIVAATTDFELPEMPTRPVATGPVHRPMSELAETVKSSPPQPRIATGSTVRRRQKA